MPRTRKAPWSLIVVSILAASFIGFIGLIFIGAVIGGASGSHVGLINYYGAISDEAPGGFFSARGPRDFIEDCEAAGRSSSVKAVVIRINSPGGSAAASEEMYRAIRRLREKKPVVVSMGDVAASGGYYMAAAADKIYANPATITGSIGVISQFLNMQGLLEGKLGIRDETLKSGAFKDAGNPFRPLRPEERQLFQSMIRDIYNQFVDDVVAGRKAATKGKLTRANLLKVADGRVLTGRQAKNALLVDELGGLHEAIDAAVKLGGLEKRRVREVASGSFGSMFGTEASISRDGLDAAVGGGVAALMRGAGSAFAQGFAQTFMQQMREQSSTHSAPQVR